MIVQIKLNVHLLYNTYTEQHLLGVWTLYHVHGGSICAPFYVLFRACIEWLSNIEWICIPNDISTKDHVISYAMICQTHLELTYWLIGDGLKIVHFGEKYVCETIVRTISSRAKVTKNDHPLPYRYFFEIFFFFAFWNGEKLRNRQKSYLAYI